MLRKVFGLPAVVVPCLESSGHASTIRCKALRNLSNPAEELELVHKDLKITQQVLKEVCSQSGQLLKLRKGIFSHPTLREPLLSNLEMIKDLKLQYLQQKNLLLALAGPLMSREPHILQTALKWYTDKLGANREDIRKMIDKYPKFLEHSIEDEVVPLWASMEEAGIDKGGFRHVVTRHPHILAMELEASSPYNMVGSLMEFGLSKQNAQWMVLHAPGILKGSFDKTIMPTVDKLRAIDISDNDIRVLMMECPELFLTNVEESVGRKLDWFSKRVGIDPRHVNKLLLGSPTVFYRFDLEVLKEGYSALQSCGFKSSACRKIIAKQPGLLGLERMELRKKAWFWIKVLRWDPKEIVEFPAYLGAPFKERILFRIALLDWRKVDLADVPLNVMFTKKDLMFLKYFRRDHVQVFRKWWKTLSVPEMVKAIKERKYVL